jgi:hypothetical protein
MKKFIRKDVINNIKNELEGIYSTASRLEFMKFLKEHGIGLTDIYDIKKLNSGYQWFIIREIEEGKRGQQLKDVWKGMLSENLAGMSPKSLFLETYIYGYSHVEQSKFLNPEVVAKCNLDFNYIKENQNKFNYFLIVLLEKMENIEISIEEIDTLKIFENTNELDKLKSKKYDLELIEQFQKVINTLIADGVNKETILYNIQSEKFKKINNTYDMFSEDIFNKNK